MKIAIDHVNLMEYTVELRVHLNLSMTTSMTNQHEKWSLTTGCYLIQVAFNTDSAVRSNLY